MDDPEATVRTDMRPLLGDPVPPTPVAGRYILHRVLGRGGTAVVHEATDTRLDRRVAVKLLRESSQDEIERERFVSEARLLAGLSHPHLVRVLDAGVDEDVPYLVLELVRGRTLAELMSTGLPPARLAEIGAQVAQALAHVHAAGIVHRDVKPGNVLVTEDGDAKLADFGIARLVDDTRHWTRTGHLVGTVAYVAPEQVSGEPAGPAVDVYAWGLVLLEALTGARAYAGTSVESALARLSRSPDIPASLPAPWRSLLVAMTARGPAQRPTALHVADRLRALASGRSPAAPATVPPRVVLAGLAAAFALLVGVAAWPSLSGPAGASTAASALRSPPGALALQTAEQSAVTASEDPVATTVATPPADDDRTGPATRHATGHHHAVRHRPHRPAHHQHKPKHHPHGHGGKHRHHR